MDIQASRLMTIHCSEIMDKEGSRKRSGVKKSMRNRIVRSGAKHLDQDTLNKRLVEAGWEGLKP